MGGEGKLYHDVEVVERTEITTDGRVVKVYRITALTKSDVRFSVNIAEKDFTKAKAQKMLTEKATLLESIKED